jgi:hypothetical protein
MNGRQDNFRLVLCMLVNLGCCNFIVPANAAPTNQSFTYDAANRLIASGSVSYDMDLAGNLREISGSVTPVLSLPSTSSVGAGAQSGLTVSVNANVNWTATSNQSWLTITNGTSGTGNGTITFSVTINAGSARPATIQVTQQGGGLSATCTVTQAAAAVSMFSVTTSSSPSPGGTTSGGGSFANGSSATVVASANSGYRFINWSEIGSRVSTAPSYSFAVFGNRALQANFVSALNVDSAIDTLGQAFFSTSGFQWFGQSTISFDNVDAVRSASIGHSQSTVLETLIEGPSSVSFHWKVSSELNNDYLSVSVGSIDQGGAISGETGWVQRIISIPSGSHWVRWVYAKNGSGSSGDDAAYVDQLVITPTVLPPVTLGAPNLFINGSRTIRTTKTRVIVRGTASDADGDLAWVKFKDSRPVGASWRYAQGTAAWQAVAVLRPKRSNIVQVQAGDATGRVSPVTRMRIINR